MKIPRISFRVDWMKRLALGIVASMWNHPRYDFIDVDKMYTIVRFIRNNEKTD